MLQQGGVNKAHGLCIGHLHLLLQLSLQASASLLLEKDRNIAVHTTLKERTTAACGVARPADRWLLVNVEGALQCKEFYVRKLLGICQHACCSRVVSTRLMASALAICTSCFNSVCRHQQERIDTLQCMRP
jgi:hypothetical protein